MASTALAPLFSLPSTHTSALVSPSFHFVSTPFHPLPESSRRDDLESLAYMLIYFLRGTLPWRKLRAPPHPPSASPSPDPSHSTPSPSRPKKPSLSTAQPQVPYNPISATWDLIRDSKLTHEAELTVGLPPELDVFFRYARGLAFDDLPDYAGLRSLFHGLAERAGIEYDGIFDWTLPLPGQGKPMPRRSASDSGVAAHIGGGKRFCEACNAKHHAGGVSSGRR